MPRRIKFKFFILLFSLFLLDRLTKNYFLNHPKVFSSPFLNLSLSKNPNLFFLSFNLKLLIFISLIILSTIFYLSFLAWQKKKIIILAGFLLIITGGISNLFDRIFYGFVIDFIWIILLPFSFFNLADVMITGGVILISLHFLKLKGIF